MDMINMSFVNSCQELDNNDHDAFYAELEKRVLTLLDDHDLKVLPRDTHKHSSSSLTTKRRLDIVKQTGNYFYWNDSGDDSVPVWISNLWRNNNKGTGVFIPSIVNSKRKYNPKRRNNYKGIVHKAV